MMMQHLGVPQMHDDLMAAIETVLRDADHLTPDMGGSATTRELGQAIAGAVGG